MKSDDLLEILDECKKLFPRQYERLIVVHPPRIVVFKMLMRYPDHLLPVVKRLFANSDEYREACKVIEEQFEQVVR